MGHVEQRDFSHGYDPASWSQWVFWTCSAWTRRCRMFRCRLYQSRGQLEKQLPNAVSLLNIGKNWRRRVPRCGKCSFQCRPERLHLCYPWSCMLIHLPWLQTDRLTGFHTYMQINTVRQREKERSESVSLRYKDGCSCTWNGTIVLVLQRKEGVLHSKCSIALNFNTS